MHVDKQTKKKDDAQFVLYRVSGCSWKYKIVIKVYQDEYMYMLIQW